MYFYIGIFLIFLFLYFFGKDLRKRWFAGFIDKMTKNVSPEYEKLKVELLKPLHSLQSHDEEFRKKNSIRILEVGVGTGANFKLYPDGTKLIVVDPNPHFKEYYNENRKKFSNIDSEEIIVTKGEEMTMVPSNSVDAVVMTLVMCSVSDIPGVLKQVYRVLAPGGKFFFFEHIREFEKDQKLRLWLQNFFSCSQIWPTIFEGCYLDRDMLKDIQSVGFSSVEGKRIYAPTKSFLWLISPHLVGVATK